MKLDGIKRCKIKLHWLKLKQPRPDFETYVKKICVAKNWEYLPPLPKEVR